MGFHGDVHLRPHLGQERDRTSVRLASVSKMVGFKHPAFLLKFLQPVSRGTSWALA